MDPRGRSLSVSNDPYERASVPDDTRSSIPDRINTDVRKAYATSDKHGDRPLHVRLLETARGREGTYLQQFSTRNDQGQLTVGHVARMTVKFCAHAETINLLLAQYLEYLVELDRILSAHSYYKCSSPTDVNVERVLQIVKEFNAMTHVLTHVWDTNRSTFSANCTELKLSFISPETLNTINVIVRAYAATLRVVSNAGIGAVRLAAANTGTQSKHTRANT